MTANNSQPKFFYVPCLITGLATMALHNLKKYMWFCYLSLTLIYQPFTHTFPLSLLLSITPCEYQIFQSLFTYNVPEKFQLSSPDVSYKTTPTYLFALNFIVAHMLGPLFFKYPSVEPLFCCLKSLLRLRRDCPAFTTIDIT